MPRGLCLLVLCLTAFPTLCSCYVSSPAVAPRRFTRHSRYPHQIACTATPPPAPTALPAVPRPVASIQKFARLPVWPVVNGVLLFLLETAGQSKLAADLEQWQGGRVCPMMLDNTACDPFVLMVYHRHSFSLWDAVRPISGLILPEGFPAHPHRGFETVTYVLKGGMTHRDSEGVKMTYTAPSVQWLTAGRGVLHEEMWAVDGPNSQQELFQIWLNLPSHRKMQQPRVQLLGEGQVDKQSGLPVARLSLAEEQREGVNVRVLSGECNGVSADTVTETDVTILHVSLDAGACWEWGALPAHHTCFLYVRSGSLGINQAAVDFDGNLGSKDQKIAHHHHTVFFNRHSTPSSRRLAVDVTAVGDAPCDFLLLSGEPIGESVASGGSMVMNTDSQVNEAYRDYEMGKFGIAWDHRTSDEQWLEGIGQNKQRMQ